MDQLTIIAADSNEWITARADEAGKFPASAKRYRFLQPTPISKLPDGVTIYARAMSVVNGVAVQFPLKHGDVIRFKGEEPVLISCFVRDARKSKVLVHIAYTRLDGSKKIELGLFKNIESYEGWVKKPPKTIVANTLKHLVSVFSKPLSSRTSPRVRTKTVAKFIPNKKSKPDQVRAFPAPRAIATKIASDTLARAENESSRVDAEAEAQSIRNEATLAAATIRATANIDARAIRAAAESEAEEIVRVATEKAKTIMQRGIDKAGTVEVKHSQGMQRDNTLNIVLKSASPPRYPRRQPPTQPTPTYHSQQGGYVQGGYVQGGYVQGGYVQGGGVGQAGYMYGQEQVGFVPRYVPPGTFVPTTYGETQGSPSTVSQVPSMPYPLARQLEVAARPNAEYTPIAPYPAQDSRPRTTYLPIQRK